MRPISVWQERLTGDNQSLAIADARGELVGMAGIFRPDMAALKHNATIHGVYVQGAARGHGIADGMTARSQPHGHALARQVAFDLTDGKRFIVKNAGG